MDHEHEVSFGVFKPVDHVVVSFPSAQQADAAVRALADMGIAERAHHYGHFIIEELLERPGRLPQVGESPDRGLDAQTPSGREADTSAAADKCSPASGTADKR